MTHRGRRYFTTAFAAVSAAFFVLSSAARADVISWTFSGTVTAAFGPLEPFGPLVIDDTHKPTFTFTALFDLSLPGVVDASPMFLDGDVLQFFGGPESGDPFSASPLLSAELTIGTFSMGFSGNRYGVVTASSTFGGRSIQVGDGDGSFTSIVDLSLTAFTTLPLSFTNPSVVSLNPDEFFDGFFNSFVIVQSQDDPTVSSTVYLFADTLTVPVGEVGALPLPLIATGLGVLGLLHWRRRKVALACLGSDQIEFVRGRPSWRRPRLIRW